VWRPVIPVRDPELSDFYVLDIRVKEAMKRGKQKWRVGDLLVDERCSPAMLDFLRSTYVGRAAPPVEEKWDSEEEVVAAAEVMDEVEEPEE